MATPIIWPLVISILLTLGLYPTAPNNFPMELNQEQAAIIIKLRESLEAYKAECKAKGVSYGHGHSKAEKAEMRDGVAILKKHYKNAVAFMEGQEEIDCSTFSNAVLQWRADLETFFEKTKSTHAKVNVNIENFKTKLSKRQSTYPLVKELYQEWQDLLSSLDAELTGEELFEALMTHSGSAWSSTTDITAIQAHYKANKKEYKKYSNSMESFRDEAMPKEQYFIDALQASSSAEDPNLPENVAEQEADSKAALKQWEQDYKDWLNETIASLNAEDTSSAGKPIDKDQLEAQINANTGAPAYAQVFWQAVIDSIQQEIKGAAGVVLYDRAVTIAIATVREEARNYITADYLEKASQSEEKEMPYGLQEWLAASVDGNQVAYKGFKEKYTTWTADIVQMVARCEDKLNSRDFKVDVKKLEQQLVAPLTFEVNGQLAGQQLLEALVKHLPAEKVVNFETLKQAWKKGITQVQTEEFVQGIWNTVILNEQAKSGIKQASVDFFTNAPSLDEFVSALEDSRYHAPKQEVAQQPTTSQKLDLVFEAKRNNNCYYSMRIPVPLKMIPVVNKEGLELYHAVPEVSGINFNSMHLVGGKSSTIDSLKEIRVEESKKNMYYEGKDHYISYVIVRLEVRDTTMERVVSKAKNGSLKLLTLSADEMSKIKGLKGCDGKFLGAGLEIKADSKGNATEIVGNLTIMGFVFNIHAGKDGVYATTKSPLEFQKAVSMATYGEHNYDLEMSFAVESVIGEQSSIRSFGIKKRIEDIGGTITSSAEKLKVTIVKKEVVFD